MEIRFKQIEELQYQYTASNATHPHQAHIIHILKSSPICQKVAFSPAFLPYKQEAAMYKNLQSPKVVIKSTDVMTPNIFMVTWALDFLWIYYRGAHKLAGSLPKDSHSNSFHIARLGNN